MILEFLTEDTTISLLVGLVSALIAVVVLRFIEDKKYPPGPYGWPIVGYLPFLAKDAHLKLMELKKKYGPIYSLSFGSKRVVIISSYASMKEFYYQEPAMGRPPESFVELNKETVDLGAFHGLGWRELKRYSLHSLRDLGFGKSQLEIYLREEIEELLDHFANAKGKPIVAEKYLTPSASNVVASLMFGKRRKFDDPKRIMLDKIFQDGRGVVGRMIVLTYFPFLKALVNALKIGMKEASRLSEALKQYLTEEIEEHQKTFDPNHIRDFIDGYLAEIEKTKDDPNSPFKVPILHDLVQLFFFPGTETIQQTVDWLIFLSAAFPEVQKRVQSEIDSVLGSERFPRRSDYLQMPYTEAVILETMRWRANSPINMPRYTLADTKVHSYVIPKNTQVLGVFWAINHDPVLWGDDVDEFKPERFLSQDEKRVRKPEYFIPFSIGRRSCPGESLASVELFLYYVAILQKFQIRLPEGFTPDFDGKLVFGLQTKPYKAIFELRK